MVPLHALDVMPASRFMHVISARWHVGACGVAAAFAVTMQGRSVAGAWF